MGLCKCPKKKVTNLFCFEHRVNVCEHCLVSNHPRCIVQSYLQWLQDSDYDPICRICKRSLNGEEYGECVRLSCYDVFHWVCLDTHARRLPANTAPAGYQCPMCKACIFPPNNLASPIADKLREVLNKVNWARSGLGLPLIDEMPPKEQAPPPFEAPPSQGEQHLQSSEATGQVTRSYTAPHQHAASHVPATSSYSASVSSSAHSVLNIDESTPYARGTETTNPRRLFDSTKFDKLGQPHDHDEDKYKRRPALQWFGRWFKSVAGTQKKDPNATFKRFVIVLVIGIIGFLTVIIIFSKLGRASADQDPFLDPMANPNIRVGGQ